MHVHFLMPIMIVAFIFICCFIIVSWPRRMYKRQREEDSIIEAPSMRFTTGEAEADLFLQKCRELIKETARLSVGISNKKLLYETNDVITADKQICDYIEKHPANARQATKIVDYYFPTAVKLLGIYNDIARQRVKVSQMNETMEEIETTMDIILKAFHKHLAGLYEQKAIDVNSEIEVLKHMAKMEGLVEDK